MSVDKSPVYEVKAVPVEKVLANDYNPNVVAPPEMKLLELSIWEDGFTMPCVCYYNKEEDNYILVDGYHRYTVLKTSKRIYKRENGLLPIVVIDKDLSNRMSSTIRHNRARGMHNIELMCNIVAELDRAGMSDQWIMKNIGMDRDELLRQLAVVYIPGVSALALAGAMLLLASGMDRSRSGQKAAVTLIFAFGLLNILFAIIELYGYFRA